MLMGMYMHTHMYMHKSVHMPVDLFVFTYLLPVICLFGCATYTSVCSLRMFWLDVFGKLGP